MTKQIFTWREKAEIFGRVASVGLHVLGEYLYPRKAWAEGDVPRSYREITPEWLSAVLCKNIPGAKVLAVEATGGSMGTSSRQGLLLTLNDQAKQAGVPQRIFTKATPKFSQRVILGVCNIIWGEIAFYNHLRKPLDIEAPKGYGACADAASLRSMIVMEDIVETKGAKFISTETYITKLQIESLLADMAKFHAYYWNNDSLKRDFVGLQPPIERLALLSKVGVKKRSILGAKRAASVIPEALIDRQEDLWRALQLSFELNQKLPQTMLHGDSHIGQTYITRDGKMGLTDWQTTQRGGWAFDFAYLVNSALTVEDRRLWEQGLVRFYLDRLHAEGGPVIPFDEAWLSYRQHGFWPYFAWVFTIGAGSLQPDDVSMDTIERTANAINDHDALALFTN
jgi:hypothetical protein